jgi:drug/metabolite transporter (DMT)-like permease
VRVPSGRVVAALVAVQVFFGLHYLLAKLALAHVPPRAWAAIRIAGAAILLVGWQALVRRRGWPARRELPRLALYSLFGVALNQILFAEGLARTTPAHSAILNSLIPVMTHALAIAAGQERATARRWTAFGVSFVSVLVLLRVERFRLDDALVVGDLLTLANGAAFSAFLVLSRDAMRRLDPLGATTCILGFGAAAIVAVGAPALAATPMAALPLGFWLCAAYAILFATVGAYALNAWALARTDSSTVALFIYLQPPLATVLSMVFWGERPGLRFFVAAAGVLAGVGLALGRGRPAQPPDAEPQPTIKGPSGLRPAKPSS